MATQAKSKIEDKQGDATQSFQIDDQDDQVERAEKCIKRIEALIAFASKRCFKGPTQIAAQAKRVQSLLGKAISDYPGMDVSPEEVYFDLLVDGNNNFFDEALKLEQLIRSHRGRISKHCDLMALKPKAA